MRFGISKSITDNVDRIALYVSLVSWSLASIAGQIFPGVSTIVSGAQAVLLPIALLALVKYFDGRSSGGIDVRECSNDFGSAMRLVLDKEKIYSNVSILACTSVKYCAFIKDSGIRINDLSLIMPSTKAICGSLIFSDEEKNRLIHEAESTKKIWDLMVCDGYVRSITTHHIDYLPMFHGAVFNGDSCIIGFFGVRPNGAGLKTTTKYAAKNTNNFGRELINDFSNILISMMAKDD